MVGLAEGRFKGESPSLNSGKLDTSRFLSQELSAKERELRKQALITAYPGLLTGPHGAVLKRAKAWTPWYILSATIPQSQLPSIFTTTDLRIALVVWRHTTAEITALSVYNNHLDANARFSSFTVDGASTSRDNPWAVGEKGKGFILATQFLFEHVEAHEALYPFVSATRLAP